MASGDLIPRVYGGFRGVDFRGEEINLVRSPDSLNMWKDYKETESIRTRPKMKNALYFDNTVYGVFFYKAGSTDMMLVHSGTELYKVVNGKKTLLKSGLNAARSSAFVYNSHWYFIDGKNYLKYDGAKIIDVEGNGKVPTTSIARKPEGGGTIYQDINMLSDYCVNTFVGDGSSTVFTLDQQKLDSEYKPVLTEDVLDKDKNIVTVKSFDAAKGTVTLSAAPVGPATEGQGNVKIQFKMPHKEDRNKIKKCTMIELFDNRVFFSGNPEHPNMLWHCSLDDPTYCSDLDYYNEGLDTAKVKGMVAGNNNLWVFKEPSQANTTVFYHTPTIDNEYGKIYPNTHSSISTGCIGKAINFNDDIVFFSDRGMEGISGDITSEQVIAHRSTVVDRKLIAEPDYADMILEEWEGYLVVIIGNKVYLADSRAMFENESHYEYEWFYWELEKKITCAKVNKGVLYLGTEDGVYTLSDNTGNVESYWVTPKDKFGHPQYQKTTNKRGCVVEAKCENGVISVYAQTEKDKGFPESTLVGRYENVTDSFVSRIKRKKFKDIQLKFHSNTRFSLEQATLECFIGGYIKR